MLIYSNANYETMANPSHPVFIAVEKEFWAWLEQSNPANEYEEKYFGEESIVNKRGAIEQAIEEMIDLANEDGTPVSIKSFDFDAVFAA